MFFFAPLLGAIVYIYNITDLMLGKYDKGYYVRKDITVSLCEPTSDELEAINAYLGRQESGVGRVISLKEYRTCESK